MLVVTGTAVGVVLAAAGSAPGPARPSSQAPATTGTPATRATPVRGSAPVVPLLGNPRAAPLAIPLARHIPPAPQPVKVAPLHGLRQADLLIVAPFSLPGNVLAAVSRQPGVTDAEPLEAARVKVNGAYAAILGVNPSTFRGYAAKPTASSDPLWQAVANGGMAVSYGMGTLDRLPLGGRVSVSGRQPEHLSVVAFGTVGIAGVDAVVSDSVAQSLGMPSSNAIVVSAQPADVTALTAKIEKFLPRGAGVEPLVTWVVSGTGRTVTSQVGDSGAGGGALMSSAQLTAMVQAALSRRGMPYVWGAAGPTSFDCSGLVEWSFAQAGLVMPRVAADQALTGEAVPVSQLAPGDLLFYRTDPTDPGYISHVAIYLGNGWMIQAPQPGMNVEVVPADIGAGFAGAVRVNPRVAAAEATGIAG